MAQKTFHLIANAHLDPVWLWDWREGLNEGISTCRTILDLMDEDPSLTFIRGEAAIYEHIERTDPDTFERIRRHVANGRWDIVGGTYIQPDTNLPATETLLRHYLRGKRYFAEKFGKNVTVAWAADSFGHPAGLPEILAQAGMRGFAYTRPFSPTGSPAFWWESPSGARVLAYRPMVGWYGSERDELPRRLDELLAESAKHDVQNIGVFYGVGNHGGGPTRRQVADIVAWAESHKDVSVVHSGLHSLFAALYEEAAVHGDRVFPTHRGEINYCLRGCYSSVAKFKYLFRKSEATVSRAETTSTAIHAALLPNVPKDGRLAAAWDAVLFNAFHDILPGSSIERAVDDQIAWLGSAIYGAQGVELDALNLLASNIDTTVPTAAGDSPSAISVLLWNPHPYPYNGPVELEGALDARPIWKYRDDAANVPYEIHDASRTAVPYQRIKTEHDAMPHLPWRVRSVVNAELDPFGWAVYTIGYTDKPERPAFRSQPVVSQDGVIANETYRVEAVVGKTGIAVYENGQPLFGTDGLGVITVEDPYGSWGDMAEIPESLDLQNVRDKWVIARVETLENGPYRATLWIRMTAAANTLDLSVSLTAGRDAVDVSARLLIDDRSARIKLVMPVDGGEQAVFDVPGAAHARKASGEVPGGRWVSVPTARGSFGFASDALYNFNYGTGTLQATIARASRYAADVTFGPDVNVSTPAVDRGELKFRFLIASGAQELQQLARFLEIPAIAQTVPASPGALERSGSLGKIEPASLSLLALKRSEDGDGVIVRVHNATIMESNASLTLAGSSLYLGPVPAGAIASWRLTSADGGLVAKPVDGLA